MDCLDTEHREVYYVGVAHHPPPFALGTALGQRSPKLGDEMTLCWHGGDMRIPGTMELKIGIAWIHGFGIGILYEYGSLVVYIGPLEAWIGKCER